MAVTPLLMQWSYYSLALSHWSMLMKLCQWSIGMEHIWSPEVVKDHHKVQSWWYDFQTFRAKHNNTIYINILVIISQLCHILFNHWIKYCTLKLKSFFILQFLMISHEYSACWLATHYTRYDMTHTENDKHDQHVFYHGIVSVGKTLAVFLRMMIVIA